MFKVLFAVICSLSFFPLHCGYQVRDGKFIDEAYVSQFSAEEHYKILLEAFYKQEWEEVLKQGSILTKNFQDFEFIHEVSFFHGVGLYYKNHLEDANESFSKYLEQLFMAPLPHVDDAINYKFLIAEAFKNGAKKHLFGVKFMPKLLSGDAYAIKIYDEILATTRDEDILAKALYSKGELLAKMKNFEDSIESLSTLTNRFPNIDIAADAYLSISEIYLHKTIADPHYPDLLFLAEKNLEYLRNAFPSDRRIKDCEEHIAFMKEVIAESIVEVGEFYERKNLPQAALVYYTKALKQFPNSDIAEYAKEKIHKLTQE